MEQIEGQNANELMLWKIYSNARSLDDSDLQKALSIITMEINDRTRNKKTHNKKGQNYELFYHDFIQEVSCELYYKS